MDYPPTSQELRDRLAGQMLDEVRRQADRVKEKAGSARQDAHRQVPRQGGDFGGEGETRMRKTARYTKNGAALLMLVVSR